jgi:hypothetical protein
MKCYIDNSVCLQSYVRNINTYGNSKIGGPRLIKWNIATIPACRKWQIRPIASESARFLEPDLFWDPRGHSLVAVPESGDPMRLEVALQQIASQQLEPCAYSPATRPTARLLQDLVADSYGAQLMDAHVSTIVTCPRFLECTGPVTLVCCTVSNTVTPCGAEGMLPDVASSPDQSLGGPEEDGPQSPPTLVASLLHSNSNAIAAPATTPCPSSLPTSPRSLPRSVVCNTIPQEGS